VLVRRPLPPPYRLRRVAPRNPLKRALALAGFPALTLIAYVAVWTAAMHGGYYKQSISDRIKTIQVENDTLQANLRKLQSPRRILALSKSLGMRPAEAVEFVDAVGARRLAQVAPLASPGPLQGSAPVPFTRWPSRPRSFR
jgi:hypothetical protein